MDARRARGRQRLWRLRAAGTAALTAAVVGSGLSIAHAAGSAEPPSASTGALAHVIIEGAPDAAASAVEELGGVVESRLSVVDGVAARVPASAVRLLRDLPGVRAVTPD